MKKTQVQLSGVEECSGNPNECASRSCDLSECPLMNNLVQQAFRLASDKDAGSVYLKYLTEAILRVGKLPSETAVLAKMKAEKEALIQRATHTQEIMGTIKENKSLWNAFDILQQGNHTRLDELDDVIITMEKLNVKTH